ncbi:MAG: methylated-DNA--[protein]-cysteine S-methyltransferase [Thermoplasmata archaeon]|nr:methylated-DNA--[protein]-cysteine S-methyltransferase [Thermoplasmata archaeon]
MNRRILASSLGSVELWMDRGRIKALNLTRAQRARGSGGQSVVRELDRYFAGEAVRFDRVPLYLTDCTEFERRVYEATRMVPFGKVATYGQIARAIGEPGAARAVGQALSRNPVAIIVPCHRVIASDGSLGGFSSGLDWKRKLLRHEGVLRSTD